MEEVDAEVVARYGGLLDDRERVEFAVPGVDDPRVVAREPRDVGLIVSDVRIVVGAVDDGEVTCIAFRDRRLRLGPTMDGDAIRTPALLDLRFAAAHVDVLEAIDRGAALWDHIDHPSLGSLTAAPNGSYGVPLPNGPIAAAMLELDGAIPEDGLAFCAALISDLDRVYADAENLIVEEFFDLKNDSWLADGEQPMSEATFRGRISPRDLVISGHEAVEVYFDDDAMFGGHAVVAQRFGSSPWRGLLAG